MWFFIVLFGMLGFNLLIISASLADDFQENNHIYFFIAGIICIIISVLFFNKSIHMQGIL
jgi:hypothetical protein